MTAPTRGDLVSVIDAARCLGGDDDMWLARLEGRSDIAAKAFRL